MENKVENNVDPQYFKLVNEVLTKGHQVVDRTNVGTISLFAPSKLDFDLKEYFPLLTTKKVFFRGVVEELLFFLSGKTQTKVLEEKGINIWKLNTSRDALDKLGLYHYEEGEGGPFYPHQWRHFGAEYPLKDENINQGFDQIKEVIRQLKEEPNSRRIILTSWNPSVLSQICLPACHTFSQYHIDPEGGIECHLYMRSSDLFLGLPFNIASYALLVHIFAHLTGRKAHRLVVSFGDAHIYLNHIEKIKQQMLKLNDLRESPKLEIIGNPEKIEDFKYENFVLKNYNPYEALKADMAV